MKPKNQKPPGHDNLSLLNTAIDALGPSRSTTGIKAARDALDTVGTLLATIRDSMIDQPDCVELGLACANVCESLNQGIKGNHVDQPGQSVLNAIEQLKATVAEIQRQFVKRGKRNIITQRLREKEDERAIAAWKIDLDRIHRTFDTELTARHDANSPSVLGDTLPGIHRETSKGYSDTDSENRPPHACVPEDLPPQTPTTMLCTTPNIHLGVIKMGANVPRVQCNVVGMPEGTSKIREDHEDQNRETQSGPGNIEAQRTHQSTYETNTPGESPPPPPRILFGRTLKIENELVGAWNTSSSHPNMLKDYGNPDGQKWASVPKDPESPSPRIASAANPDIRRDVAKIGDALSNLQRHVADLSEGFSMINRDRATKNSVPESPPPPKRIFGRDGLIEKIVGFAEQLMPIALVGSGGIGKTSIALKVLHDDRIKQRFGDDRRFVGCDKFHPSLADFLRRLSKAIGAGIENPEDLSPLRKFLSSKEMMIVLDNADPILDPQGQNAKEIYSAIEELSQFSNIFLCITSRISIVPPDCEIFDIPTLSMEAARDAFHHIYKPKKRSDLVDDILEQLEFHPPSIALLATIGYQNRWSIERLVEEWKQHGSALLETKHMTSPAEAIELSLASPSFRDFGPDARELLGVVAFYPQGVDESKLDWLFPTTPNIAEILDNFCILSLTYRSGGFVTMLPPLREYLSPKDPSSSPLLCGTKDQYFSRLSAVSDVKDGEGRWIVSEDANVEHLLDVFTSIDANSDNVWGACIRFISHLYWHKPRSVKLGQKIKGLPDDHPSKPDCLFWLSNLAQSVGDHSERESLLTQALELWKVMGDLPGAAMKLRLQFNANSEMGRFEEAIRQARGALGIFEQLGDPVGQSRSMTDLAQALAFADQLDAAEIFASRAITLLPKDSDIRFFFHGHRVLGGIYRSKGKGTKAIEHLEEALKIASSRDWHNEIPPLAVILAVLLSWEGNFDKASAHVERARPHAAQADSALNVAQLMGVQATIWAKQDRFEEAVSEMSRAVDAFEKLGASKDAEMWRSALDGIKVKMQPLAANPAQMPGESNNIIDKYTIPAWVSASGSPKHVVFLQGPNGKPYVKVVEDRGGSGVEQQE